MKTAIVLLASFILVSPLLADPITLEWDGRPAGQNWTEVRAYDKAGSVYTLLGKVAGDLTRITVNVDSNAHTFIVRSFDGIRESADSNAVLLPAAPLPPGNLRTIILAAIGIGSAIVAILIFFFKKKP